MKYNLVESWDGEQSLASLLKRAWFRYFMNFPEAKWRGYLIAIILIDDISNDYASHFLVYLITFGVRHKGITIKIPLTYEIKWQLAPKLGRDAFPHVFLIDDYPFFINDFSLSHWVFFEFLLQILYGHLFIELLEEVFDIVVVFTWAIGEDYLSIISDDLKYRLNYEIEDGVPAYFFVNDFLCIEKQRQVDYILFSYIFSRRKSLNDKRVITIGLCGQTSDFFDVLLSHWLNWH